MTRTAFPARPMMRVSEPGDIGRALRFAGRTGHQAALSAARLREVADVVRAMAISLVLDAHGGWIGVRDLGRFGSPGLEVVAFDRPGATQDGAPEREWTHLHSQLRGLRGPGARVAIHRTPAGGTALWTRITDATPPEDGAHAIELSGLLQAPPGRPAAGWSARVDDGRLRLTVCDVTSTGPEAAAVAERILHTPLTTHGAGHDAHFSLLGEGREDVDAALVEIDLRNRAVRVERSGTLWVTLVIDGIPTTIPTALPDRRPRLEQALHWQRDLAVLAHTAGIRRSEEVFVAAELPHPALACAALMRDQREPTPNACVVAARVA